MDPSKTLYLFDTFGGFRQEDIDDEQSQLGDLGFDRIKSALEIFKGSDTTGYPSDKDPEELIPEFDVKDVILNVAGERDKSNIESINGWIPDSFKNYETLQFCFAHLDLVLYSPTMNALEFIWPRLVDGGTIAIHDFLDVNFVGANKAVREFSKAHGITPIVLPDIWGTTVIAKHSIPSR